MADPQIDPAGNTQQFKAFAQRRQEEEAAEQRSPALLITGIIVGAIAVAAIIYLLFIR
ncbi:MAG: hypothetical protein DIU60_011765 [Actinomycetes bacterium]|jgi:hypothetical protein